MPYPIDCPGCDLRVPVIPPAHVPNSGGEKPKVTRSRNREPVWILYNSCRKSWYWNGSFSSGVVICKSKALMHPKTPQNCASVSSNLDSIAGRTVEFRIDCYPSELVSAIRNEDVAPDMPKINPQICHFVCLNLGFLLSFFHRNWWFTFLIHSSFPGCLYGDVCGTRCGIIGF